MHPSLIMISCFLCFCQPKHLKSWMCCISLEISSRCGWLYERHMYRECFCSAFSTTLLLCLVLFRLFFFLYECLILCWTQSGTDRNMHNVWHCMCNTRHLELVFQVKHVSDGWLPAKTWHALICWVNQHKNRGVGTAGNRRPVNFFISRNQRGSDSHLLEYFHLLLSCCITLWEQTSFSWMLSLFHLLLCAVMLNPVQ